MTNTNAILRKSVFTSIYIIVLIVITYYLYDIFYSIPSSGLIFAVVILPISIMIFIRKLIQYIIYVLSVRNSDIVFLKYKDTKRAISERSRKILRVSTIITVTASLAICVYSGFSILYSKEAYNSELISKVSLSNLSNIDYDISDNETRIKDSIVIWPAKMYKDLSKYKLTNKETKDGDILEPGYAHVIIYNIESFPRWYLKVYFNTVYEGMVNSQEYTEQKAIITEIKESDYYGYCMRRVNDAEVEILLANGHDLVYISIGTDQDSVYIDDEQVMKIASSLLSNQ